MLTAPTLAEIESALLAGQHAVALELASDAAAGEWSPAQLIQLANILSAHGQNPRAANLLARACAAQPDDPQILAQFAQLQWMAGRTDDAISTLRKALTRWPQMQGLYRMLGMQFLTAGKHLDAFMAYAAALQLSPDDAASIMGRACAFRLLANQRQLTVRLGAISAKFALSGRSISVDFAHLSEHFYEETELAALAAIAPRGGTVVDVGANLGNHAIFLLHALAPTDLILFEPNPACVQVLKDNFALNPAPATHIVLHTEGVGSVPGELFFNSHDDLNNGLVPVAQGNAQRVEIVPLDQRVTRADVLKIDVEGMEVDVLRGAHRILTESRPVLFVEVQKRNSTAFNSLLSEYVYSVHQGFDCGDYTNIIAVPASL